MLLHINLIPIEHLFSIPHVVIINVLLIMIFTHVHLETIWMILKGKVINNAFSQKFKMVA